MEVGTRVKLTAKAAKTRSHGYLNRKARKDWTDRKGVVCRNSTGGRICVVWEGNRGPEQLQLVEVERSDE